MTVSGRSSSVVRPGREPVVPLGFGDQVGAHGLIDSEGSGVRPAGVEPSAR